MKKNQFHLWNQYFSVIDYRTLRQTTHFVLLNSNKNQTFRGNFSNTLIKAVSSAVREAITTDLKGIKIKYQTPLFSAF